MRRVALALALVASLVAAASAAAAWNGPGAGNAYSKGETVAAGNVPSVSVSGRNATVSWTATGGPVPVTGYVIRRFEAGGTEDSVGASCSGVVTGLSCTESGVPPGNWRYTVTPARQNWRGAQSAQSTAASIGAPNLTLDTTSFSVLRATTSGQIQNFKGGQTVTFRLDHPSTGPQLTGSITPSPVPSNGTANVSLAIPSGIASGSHTVYAIGNDGDQASANISVNTGSDFFATGSYTGNAADNRAITGLGFNPQVVIVKGTNNQIGVIRTDTMSGDMSKPMTGSTALSADRVQSLDADGFTLGANAQVNANGTSYRWMAFRALDGVLRTGTYTGNGTGQSLSGLGFSPEQLGVFSAAGQSPYQRYVGMTRSFTYGSDTGITTGITSLDGNGFSLGNSTQVNNGGTEYHYVAFNDTPGAVEIDSYTGNGSDGRDLTGVGINPAYVQVRANNTATARTAVHRPSSLSGDATMFFTNTANATNHIQQLLVDGFQLGTNAAVNANGNTYHYMAVKNASPSPSCSSPGSSTLTASADAWIDQGSPTTNNGTATSLQVRSGAFNLNRRTLVEFNLPSIPAGCSLSQATLNLFSTAASTGRTIDVYRADGSWTEGGVTWNNAPATAGTAASAAAATGTVSWDVTSQTQAMYSPGPDDGFIVRDSAEGSLFPQQTYQAREDTPDVQDPSLYVAWN
jgi:hypothetical protein